MTKQAATGIYMENITEISGNTSRSSNLQSGNSQGINSENTPKALDIGQGLNSSSADFNPLDQVNQANVVANDTSFRKALTDTVAQIALVVVWTVAGISTVLFIPTIYIGYCISKKADILRNNALLEKGLIDTSNKNSLRKSDAKIVIYSIIETIGFLMGAPYLIANQVMKQFKLINSTQK